MSAFIVNSPNPCGGDELNYVSDVDVIFVAATDEDLPAATQVATRLIHICGLISRIGLSRLRLDDSMRKIASIICTPNVVARECSPE